MVELSTVDEMIISEYIRMRIIVSVIMMEYFVFIRVIYIVRMRNNIEYQSKGELCINDAKLVKILI